MWLALSASAAPFAPTDEGDARYLAETRRHEQAADWLFAHLEEGTGAAHLTRWLEALGAVPHARHPALPAVVDRWLAAHPVPDAAVARVYARWAAGLGPNTWAQGGLGEGAWCAEGLALLEGPLPDDPVARYRTLVTRGRARRVCEVEVGTDWEEAEALARTGAAGAYPRAWWAVRGGAPLDEADLAAIREVIATQPGRIGELAPALRVVEGERPAGFDTARALLLEAAAVAAASDDPVSAWGAAEAYAGAELPVEAAAAYARVASLDPDNRAAALRATPRAPARDGVDAHTVLDPVARLEALRAAGPPDGNRFDQATYWGALAEAAATTGDAALALEATEALHRVQPWGTAESLARAALRADDHLVRARRALDAEIDRLASPDSAPAPEADPARWRQDWASALEARAAIAARRGRPGAVVEDLALACRLEEVTPTRAARLAVAQVALGWTDGEVLARLGWAAARLPADDPDGLAAREALATLLPTLPGWPPTVDEFVAATRPAPAAPAVAEVAPSALSDLSWTWDGVAGALSAIEGPVVLDVWATWCGPCTASLPHLEGLARAYAGRATMVALNVDTREETAARYLTARGDDATFVRAWAGADGMRTLGIDSIPRMFVLDAEHRLVATLSGWSPGDDRLDRALRTAVGPPNP